MRRRPPRSAAVAITCTDTTLSYADALKKAREKIGPLDKLGIKDSKMRRGVNGGLIIEILGPENAAKADALAQKLRETLKVEARISRPTAMGELQIWNMDDTVDVEEVRSVVSVNGDCDLADIRVGFIRRMYSGLNSVWLKCPLAAAIKVAAEGKVRMGWTSARVRLLEARPVQCFKCWRFGHVRNTCKFPEDRTGNCFRCGSSQHVVKECRAPSPNAPSAHNPAEMPITAWDPSLFAMSRDLSLLPEHRCTRMNNTWRFNGGCYPDQSEQEQGSPGPYAPARSRIRG